MKDIFSQLTAISELRRLLFNMEKSLGLSDLSGPELNVLLAAHASSQDPGEVISSASIRNHELACDLTKPTFHRALRDLIAMGLLEKAEGAKTQYYRVSKVALDQLADQH